MLRGGKKVPDGPSNQPQSVSLLLAPKPREFWDSSLPDSATRLPATDTTFRPADKWEGGIIWSTLGLISWLYCGPTWARMLHTGADSDPNLTYKSAHLKIMLEHRVPTLGCNQPGSVSVGPCGISPAKSCINWFLSTKLVSDRHSSMAEFKNKMLGKQAVFSTQGQASGPCFTSYCQKMSSCRSCFFLLLHEECSLHMKNYSANWQSKLLHVLFYSGDTLFSAVAPTGIAVAVQTLLALQQEISLQDFRYNMSPL